MEPSFTRWLPELEPEPACCSLPEEGPPQTGMYRVGRGCKLEWKIRDLRQFSWSLSFLDPGTPRQHCLLLLSFRDIVFSHRGAGAS